MSLTPIDRWHLKKTRQLTHFIIKTAILISTVSSTVELAAQTKITGHYFTRHWMMGEDLKIKRNHRFRLRSVNWESGNGSFYQGKWSIKNDTLMLQYKTKQKVKGRGHSGTVTSRHKESESKTEILIISGSNLCSKLPVDDNCYKKQ